jgi:voltage-gated potassium channel
MANSPKKSLRLRDLDHDQRRRVSIESALRCVLLVVVLLLLYAVWPFDTAPDAAWDVVVLGFAGVLFVWVLVRQVRHIMAARLPEVRAIEALVVSITLFVVLVSGLYLYLSGAVPSAFSESLDRMGALYFTVTVLATVGFGDIHPVGSLARAAVTGQMVMDVVLVGVVVRVLVAAAKISLKSAPEQPAATSED